MEGNQSNIDYSLIRFIDLGILKNLREFPRCPNEIHLTNTLDSIDRNVSLLVFISHCWMRPNIDVLEANPDNETSDKFRLCVEGVSYIWKYLAPRTTSCYAWFEYGCVDQDSKEKLAETFERYDKIVEVCDCIFTPIVNKGEPVWLKAWSDDRLASFESSFWSGKPHGYIHRAWCRVEMLYAVALPLLGNTNGVERHTLFELGLAHHCKNNRRPHILFSNQELDSNNGLPPLQYSIFEKYHPLKGFITIAKDMDIVSDLVNMLNKVSTTVPLQTGYTGNFNERGEKHGTGKEVLEDGTVYEGQWKDGVKHGRGVLTFYYGASYEGEFNNGKSEGRGIFRSSVNGVYEGEYLNNVQEGQGVYRYVNGNLYEGEWRKGKRTGQGVFTFSDGTVYEGEFMNDAWEGQGSLKKSNGDTYTGTFKNSSYDGCGTYCCADGSVFVGQFKDNKRHGQGWETNPNGERRAGTWYNDVFVDNSQGFDT